MGWRLVGCSTWRPGSACDGESAVTCITGQKQKLFFIYIFLDFPLVFRKKVKCEHVSLLLNLDLLRLRWTDGVVCVEEYVLFKCLSVRWTPWCAPEIIVSLLYSLSGRNRQNRKAIRWLYSCLLLCLLYFVSLKAIVKTFIPEIAFFSRVFTSRSKFGGEM